jgi:hypothetical protein
MKHQRGISFFGLIIILAFFGFIGVIAMQVAPTAVEYQAIGKAAKKASVESTV